jgi:hypothetical protein
MLTCHSTDLYGSIDALSEPYFEGFDLSIVPSNVPCQDIYFSEGFQKVNNLVHLKNDFNRILRKVEDATIALNGIHVGNTTIKPLHLRDALTSIQYVLLCMELSRHDVHESKSERICRLGVLLYLVTNLNSLLPGASQCDMLAATVRVGLGNMTETKTITPGFRWGVAVLIVVIASDEVNKSWTMMTIERTILDGGLCRRGDMEAALMKFF